MEGYIRNLNTEKLWMCRPFYVSNTGTYYYGDWMGIDPTNTSYFEATVHTYAKVSVEGNSVVLNGYVQNGTDKIEVQGFTYWLVAPTAGMTGATRIPAGAQTIVASGKVMKADLANLEYNSTYAFVAFATTSEGETFYGEEQTFTTGEQPTGIGDLTPDPSPKGERSEYASNRGIYTLQGVKVTDDIDRLRELPRGLYIVNGKKVAVK